MKWLRRLFTRKKKKEVEVIGETDPHIIAMIKACYESGEPVRGEVDENGKLNIERINP